MPLPRFFQVLLLVVFGSIPAALAQDSEIEGRPAPEVVGIWAVSYDYNLADGSVLDYRGMIGVSPDGTIEFIADGESPVKGPIAIAWRNDGRHATVERQYEKFVQEMVCRESYVDRITFSHDQTLTLRGEGTISCSDSELDYIVTGKGRPGGAGSTRHPANEPNPDSNK